MKNLFMFEDHTEILSPNKVALVWLLQNLKFKLVVIKLVLS